MKENYYVDNNELEQELEKWRLSSPDPNERVPSERLGLLLISLHDGVLKHKNFNRYRQDLKDEMKSYSLFRILKCGLKSFDPQKAKAFSYFTRSIFTNYVSVVMRYYKLINKLREYIKGQLMKLAETGNLNVVAYVEHFSTGSRPD